MNTFQSSELFGAFLVFVAVFILLVLLDLCYQYWNSSDVEKPISERSHTLRFRVKKVIARILLKLGRRKAMNADKVDQIQVFSDDDPMPVDAVYFNTSSPSKQIVVFSTARRKAGLVNSMGFLKVPEFSNQLLVLPIFPQTSLYQTEKEQNNLSCYEVAGIKLTPVVPNKEYRIEYNGKMALESDRQKEFDVQLNAVWRSDLPPFNFSADVSQIAMSEAMALEPWTKQYFDNLKSHHQTHYEQYGSVEGVVKIDGKAFSIRTSGLRDRTIGAKRDWNDFHRYMLSWFQLENGNAISIGVVSVPVMFSRLIIGFVTRSDDNAINIPIDSCSIDLNEYNKSDPPMNYDFDFIANNDSYRVHVNRHTKTTVFMGEQSESCIIETWCDVKVNGIKGWGAVEWQYQNEKKTHKY